jgi:hypothetical protein
MDVNIPLLFVMIMMNALLTLAIVTAMFASTPPLIVMITTNVQVISVLKDTVTTLKRTVTIMMPVLMNIATVKLEHVLLQ